LGQALARILRSRGHPIRVFDLPQALASLGEALAGEAAAGDVTSAFDVQRALDGMQVVAHLAAMLPPLSERQPELASQVNVEGTRLLLEMLPKGAPLLFASSVATYGVPQEPVVTVAHPQHPLDVYAETKVAAESLVRASHRAWAILRLAPIAVPAVLDLPDPWPFTAQQSVEFIALQDAATAIANAVENHPVSHRVFNIAGGKSWQMTGGIYSARMSSAFDLDPLWATFRESPGWAGWYDTAESQAALAYQQTEFEAFMADLHRLYQEAIRA